ncbi:MAG: pentapeptide repeat-containing protein [Nostoc sp.]|uniref:pentapeptide repeat-containing protein n=1 Tax=Nostoc sp. TaxID=1180 RepID=UPI002FFD0DEF
MTAEELLERYAAGERDFSGVNLEGVNLSGTELRGIILRGANLRQANLRDSDLSGCWEKPNPMVLTDLREANCCEVDFSGTTLEVVDFSNAILTGANFNSAVLDRVWFIDANLEDVNWSECRVWRFSVEGARLGTGLEDIIRTDWRKRC